MQSFNRCEGFACNTVSPLMKGLSVLLTKQSIAYRKLPFLSAVEVAKTLGLSHKENILQK